MVVAAIGTGLTVISQPLIWIGNGVVDIVQNWRRQEAQVEIMHQAGDLVEDELREYGNEVRGQVRRTCEVIREVFREGCGHIGTSSKKIAASLLPVGIACVVTNYSSSHPQHDMIDTVLKITKGSFVAYVLILGGYTVHVVVKSLIKEGNDPQPNVNNNQLNDNNVQENQPNDNNDEPVGHANDERSVAEVLASIRAKQEACRRRV